VNSRVGAARNDHGYGPPFNAACGGLDRFLNCHLIALSLKPGKVRAVVLDGHDERPRVIPR